MAAVTRGPPTPSAEDDRWIPNGPHPNPCDLSPIPGLPVLPARPRPAVPASGDDPPAPPGLKAQLGVVRLAVLGFVRAHIDLAKAEMDEIGREIGRASGLAAAAIALVILMSLLVAIGGMLFTGEWIFGSIGWGVLLGAELLIAVAVTARARGALRAGPRAGRGARRAAGDRRRADPRLRLPQRAVHGDR